jgi:putative flippase GtrA
VESEAVREQGATFRAKGRARSPVSPWNFKARKWFNHCTTPHVATSPPRRDRFRVLRALLAGGAATLADIGVLALLVALIGLSPRVASIPALLAGGVVNFLGNRHFAFRATEGSLPKQAVLYAIVELAALGANGLLFDIVMRLLPPGLAWAYVPVRLVTSHIVFLAWSYPLWRLVFRVPQPAQAV